MAATYTKPTTIPRWADTSGNVVEPSSGKKDAGWLVQEKAISSWQNWMQKSLGDWVKWLNERLYDGATKDECSLRIPGQYPIATVGNKFFRLTYGVDSYDRMAIRMSETLGEEMQFVLSEGSGLNQYPTIAYNIAYRELLIDLARDDLADEIRDTAIWKLNRYGEMYLKSPYEAIFELAYTGGTGTGRDFQFRSISKQLKITNDAVTTFMVFDSASYSILSTHLLPFGLRDLGSSSTPWENAYIDNIILGDTDQAIVTRLARAWGRFQVIAGSGVSIYQSISHNISAVTLSTNTTIKVTLSKNLKPYSCVPSIATQSVNLNWTWVVDGASSSPDADVFIQAYDATTGATIDFSTTSVVFALTVFGEWD